MKQLYHIEGIKQYLKTTHFASLWRGQTNITEPLTIYTGVLFMERKVRDMGYYEMNCIETKINDKILKVWIDI